MIAAVSTTPGFSFLYGNKKLIMNPAQIIRLEAKNNYTRVFFTDHPPILMAKVLNMYDKMLCPYGFVRTHRSHLVNLKYVETLDQNGIVRMKDASQVGLSRRKKQEVYSTFNMNRVSV
jgi:two-component system LytT family response regulator